MTTPNCGCDSSSSESEYLMVRATASESSTCGDGSPSTGRESCDKQEPMYDYSLSDFVIPSTGFTTSMAVCNPGIYAVGMWLQFIDPVVSLKIVNISNDILSLMNGCGDGLDIDENPDPGLAVSRNTKFVVSGGPLCETDEEEWDRISQSFSFAKEICTPNLEQASITAIVHPVGRIDSDPSNLGVGKCIKRLYGFIMNAGRPIFSALGNPLEINSDTIANYRPVVKHKTGNGLFQRKNYSESPDIEPNTQYGLGVTTGSEKLQPTYFTRPGIVTIEENTVETNPVLWPVLETTFTKEYLLTSFAGATPPSSHALDHYYAIVRIEVATLDTPLNVFRTTEVSLNGVKAGRSMTFKDDDATVVYNSISIPIKVLKSDNKLTLEMKTSASIQFYYKISVDGLMY